WRSARSASGCGSSTSRSTPSSSYCPTAERVRGPLGVTVISRRHCDLETAQFGGPFVFDGECSQRLDEAPRLRKIEAEPVPSVRYDGGPAKCAAAFGANHNRRAGALHRAA